MCIKASEVLMAQSVELLSTKERQNCEWNLSAPMYLHISSIWNRSRGKFSIFKKLTADLLDDLKLWILNVQMHFCVTNFILLQLRIGSKRHTSLFIQVKTWQTEDGMWEILLKEIYRVNDIIRFNSDVTKHDTRRIIVSWTPTTADINNCVWRFLFPREFHLTWIKQLDTDLLAEQSTHVLSRIAD